MTQTYQSRAQCCTNPTAVQLLQLMADKESNLALSADVSQKTTLLQLADQIGPEICLLKTHIDIIEDFDQDLVIQLKKLADKHKFLIFEDRKFADIGNTVALQYAKGIYRIADWADIVNAHTVPGPGVIEGLKKIGLNKNRGLLLLAEMSSKGSLAKDAYTQATLTMAQQHKDFVMGFITQHQVLDDPCFINMTPGIKMQDGASADDLGQQYRTPHTAITEHGTDIIIVGRGIYQADDPIAEAKKYRQAGWQAYLERSKQG